MLKASDLRAGHGDRTIFDGLTLTLPAGRRAGLVGPNGAGKSTLLALLAGAAAPERGSVAVGPGDRIGHLPQEPPGAGLTIDRLLGAALGEVWTLRGELARLEPRLHEPAALAAYGEAQERFDALGGWALQGRLDGARDALGIAHVPLDAPLGDLSGGEAARALLAGVLLAEPTILLLDEPTNHLDLDGLAWLEAFLAGFDGSVLVVSHDRRFLDATVTQILELEDGELRAYEGGYSAYRAELAASRARTARAYEAQRKRHRRLEADIRTTRGQALHTELTVSRAEAPRLKRYAKKVAAKASAREHRLQRELDSGRVHRQAAPQPGAEGRDRRRRRRAPGRRAAGGRRRLGRTSRCCAASTSRSTAATGSRSPARTAPASRRCWRCSTARSNRSPAASRGRSSPPRCRRPPTRSRPTAVPPSTSASGRRSARARRGACSATSASRARPRCARWARSARASAPAPRSRRSSPPAPSCCCSTSPRTTSTCRRSRCSRARCSDYPGAIVAASHDRAFLEAIGCERRLEVRAGEVTET